MNDLALLVEKAKAGDPDCFASLYEQVADDLYRMALYTLGNAHDAQDAVAETFMEAYKGLASLRDNAAFRAWILRILSFRCKRKIKQYVKERGTVDIDDLAALSGGPDLAETGINRADLVSALAQLAPAEREIVLLSVVYGYTTREIAGIVGAPHGTVSSKLHRSLKKLRALLEA
ncbi:MAG: RNA polymerase sigma factor [Provencibacterium sp.]|nr:RNA polymerase sigma factor [Provencibacterium sp.]